MNNSNFIEIQQFRQGWLLAIVLAALIYIGFMVFRNWPMSGTNMLIYGAIALALVLVPVFILSIKMVTEVKNDAIHIRFFPLKREIIHSQKLQNAMPDSTAQSKNTADGGFDMELKEWLIM